MTDRRQDSRGPTRPPRAKRGLSAVGASGRRSASKETAEETAQEIGAGDAAAAGALPPAPGGARRNLKPDADARVEWAMPAVMLLIVLLALAPVELSLHLGGVLLPPYRALLLLLAIPVMSASFAGKAGPLRSFDWLIVAQGLWFAFCRLVKYGGAGTEAAGSYVVETVIPYFLIRLALREEEDTRRISRFLFLALILPVLAGALEAPLGQRLVHDLAYTVTRFHYHIQVDHRFGMLRAASTFEHPILFGLFCASCFAIILAGCQSLGQAILRGFVVGVGVFMSLSTGPLLLFNATLGLLALERLSRGMKNRVLVFSILFACVVVFLNLASNRGFVGLIATGLTMNPQSGYYRIHIWNYSIDDVMAHPLMGIRVEDWTKPHWMSSSLDNNWLLVAFNGGLPLVLMTSLPMLLIWRALGRREAASPLFVRMRSAWGITVLALGLAAATVAYFGKMLPLEFLLLGFGAALVGTRLPSAEPEATSEAKTGPRDAPRSRGLTSGRRSGAASAKVGESKADQELAPDTPPGRGGAIRPASPADARPGRDAGRGPVRPRKPGGPGRR